MRSSRYDLNGANHSVRFLTQTEFQEAHRVHLAALRVQARVRHELTWQPVDIRDQDIQIQMLGRTPTAPTPRDPDTGAVAPSSCGDLPVENTPAVLMSVDSLVRLMLAPTPMRARGDCPHTVIFLEAGPGEGKTWALRRFILAAAQHESITFGASQDAKDCGGCWVPIFVSVSDMVALLRRLSPHERMEVQQEPLLWHLCTNLQTSSPKHVAYLRQAYQSRSLVVVLDDADEADDTTELLAHWLIQEAFRVGLRVLASCKPQGAEQLIHTVLSHTHSPKSAPLTLVQRARLIPPTVEQQILCLRRHWGILEDYIANVESYEKGITEIQRLYETCAPGQELERVTDGITDVVTGAPISLPEGPVVFLQSGLGAAKDVEGNIDELIHRAHRARAR